jgi:lysophospholipase L1-like esterase
MRKPLFLVTALGLGLFATAHAAPAGPDRPWLAAWVSSTVEAIPAKIPTDVRDYVGQTVRQTLRLEAAGSRVRVVLTNELGKEPVHVGDAHFALCDREGTLLPGTDRPLTFSGRKDVVIPPGAPLLSDPVELHVPAFAEAAVSVYYPEAARPAAHLSRVFLSGPGDHAADAAFAGAEAKRGPALASRVEVIPDAARRVVVAVGDSITEGAGATPNAHMDWPEQFALRLAKSPGGGRWSVVNAGISGGRLLHDGGGAGPNTLARYDRDVLDVPGVTDVILLEGINDIGWGTQPQGAGETVSAEDVIAADRQLIARAHARGVKVYGATLLPYEGASYYDLNGEKKREAVNAFIRSGAFDGVIDFEAVIKDPADPLRYRPAFDHGDHLHPSDAGYSAMADAIPLDLFAR